jgi:hypothetical protein
LQTEVTEGGFDGAEEALLGEVEQGVGHPPQGRLGGGAEAVEELLEAGFTVKRGGRRGRSGVREHANPPGVRAKPWGAFPPPKAV